MTPSAPTAASQDVVTPPAPCKSVCLVAGQHSYVGKVDVAVAPNGDLLVTYTSTVRILETHADIFTSIAQLQAAHKLSGGGAIPGKFAYKASFTAPGVNTYTVTIPKAAVDALGTNEFFIATHAALANGETAWGGLCTEGAGGNVSLNTANQFPGSNWGVYFSFNSDECAPKISYTYAWEDLNNTQNDLDYNDLVIQSRVIKSATQLDLTFIAKARGAGYDHKFRFRIPKTGVTGIYHAVMGDMTVTSDADYFYVTVFESTKAALPGGAPSLLFANTVAEDACTPDNIKSVTVTFNPVLFNPLYNSAKPYEPYISVYTSGNALIGLPDYDLYVRSITDRSAFNQSADTFYNFINGYNVYPNGIVIPADWRWPSERIDIRGPYPGFTSLNSPTGFTANWYTNLANPALTFVRCN